MSESAIVGGPSLPQERKLVTAIPGPKSQELLARKNGAVASGVGVTLVRILTLIAFLLPFVGVGAYVVVWILTPWQNGSIPLERWLDGVSGQGR